MALNVNPMPMYCLLQICVMEEAVSWFQAFPVTCSTYQLRHTDDIYGHKMAARACDEISVSKLRYGQHVHQLTCYRCQVFQCFLSSCIDNVARICRVRLSGRKGVRPRLLRTVQQQYSAQSRLRGAGEE